MSKTRTDLLNLICEIRQPQRYLEIGIQKGENFMAVNCPVKVGVDPAPFEVSVYDYAGASGHQLYQLKSDAFFASAKGPGFDLIFVDGDHSAEQTEKDIYNAVYTLNNGGLVVCHDALPHTLAYTRPEWCGTAYMAIMKAAQWPGLECITWEGDHGCAIFKVRRSLERLENPPVIPSFRNLWANDGAIVNKSTWKEVEAWLRAL